MISYRTEGDFSKANSAFKKMLEVIHLSQLDKYGKAGVEALKNATPVDTGKTANSWTYEIKRTKEAVEISYNNTNVNNGVNIAIILQYGHGTKNGGYVRGRDYINPAIQPIFDEIAETVEKELSII